jgi:uncharacterized protein (TIGR00251 family)
MSPVQPSGPWRLRVRVQPRASRSRLAGRIGEAIKLQVQAPPVEGAANAAVVGLLADILGLPRSAIRIAHGVSGRDKLVEIVTGDPAECRRRLEAALVGAVDKRKGGG